MFHRNNAQDKNSDNTSQNATRSMSIREDAKPMKQESAGTTPRTVEKAAKNTTTTNNQPSTTQKEEKPMSNENNEAQSQQRPVDIPGSSPYQRPMSGPAQYGYAGMQSNNMQSQSSGRRLMIGEGITLSGEIEACDHLVVEGTVEAALKGAKVLDIAENGVYYGTVEIENATIAGRFEGDIRVDGRLTVKSTGIIIGTISYKELAVESGATMDGKISPLNAPQAVKSDKPQATTGAADFSKSKAAAKQTENAKSDEQLPFGQKATANA